MKRIIIFIIFMTPMIVSAQISSVSEAQKQQALQIATEFCTLFEQWCGGQRMLDQQIYALCSGKDCSTYDDVSTNSETSLRNYLLGIQKKYPQKLTVQISKPSLTNSSITYEPAVNISNRIGDITGSFSPFSIAQINELNSDSYVNAYIVFKVTHQISGLAKNNERLLIYDVNLQKITTYVIGSGTFVSFLEGLNLMVKRDYVNAIKSFDRASGNHRTSIRRDCLLLALTCCSFSMNFEKIKYYTNQLNDKFYSAFFDGLIYLSKENLQDAFNCYLECERLLNTSESDAYEGLRNLVYLELGVSYAVANEFNLSIYSPSKAVYYLKKSIELENVQAAYMLWHLWIYDENIDKLISTDESLTYLHWAAEMGHPSCMIISGQWEETVTRNSDEAERWYTKGANNGDPLCMALLGKLLIRTGIPDNISKGKGWLRKSLEGNALEKYLEGYQDLMGGKFWPKSRAEVQMLLNTTPNTSTSGVLSVTSGGVSVAQNTSSSVYSSTYSSTSPSTSHNSNYRHSFNEKQDDYVGAFSMGYVQKQWVIDYGEQKEKMGVFDDDKAVNGIQVGFIVDPQFGYGLGINTGIFYEYYFSKSDEIDEGYGPYRYKFHEHSLYLPLHFKYSMNFSEWFQLSLYGGLGLDCGLVGKLSIHGDNYESDSESVYSKENEWKRFNYSLEYGASIRVKNVQFNFTKAIGLSNWSISEDYTLKQNKNLSLSVAFCY